MILAERQYRSVDTDPDFLFTHGTLRATPDA